MSKKNNNKNNVQENIFFKNSNINIKDYIPNNIKENNIREEYPLNYPDVTNRKYVYELYPNCLFEKWPSDEEIKTYDFNINSDIVFNDPNNNLLVLPYSLRKETFNSMVWMRPNEYLKQKLLISEIKKSFPHKNFYFIKNKFSMAYNNILNFKINKNNTTNDNINNKINKYIDNQNNINEIINEENDNGEEGLNSIDNFKIDIKKRNSIDISTIQSEECDYTKDFINGKLSNKERDIFEKIEKEENLGLFVVKGEIIEIIEEKEIEKKINNKNKNIDKETEIKYKIRLLPNNINLNNYLTDYCRWIASIFQIIIDNKINCENGLNHFLRRIYPQDENGTPKYNPSGKYWVKLYHMGEERKIEIDDKIPVNKTTFEPFFPQCESPYELWPLILTKAIIKLYSFKYHSDNYEYNEVGDNSILYSLTKYIGIQLTNDKFYSFLHNIRISDNNKREKKNITEKQKIKELIMLRKNKSFNYDLLIGYFKSKNLDLENNENIKKIENSNTISISPNKKPFYLPSINKKSDLVKYNEKISKINHRNSFLKSNNLTISKEILKPSWFKDFSLSPSSIKEFSNKLNIYNRFKIGEGSRLYNNSQKYMVSKMNKVTNKGIISDIGYSILELFLSHNFNMKRTRPISFNDLKLDIKLKYKQMNAEEKIKYIENLKELKITQKNEKKIRINEYLDIGKNLMFIRIYNGSVFNYSENNEKIDSSYSSKEIKIAKFCIDNQIPFPPEKYFENTFISKLYKDEDTGEINFWTKNFYEKLLKKYFLKKIIEKEDIINDNIIYKNNNNKIKEENENKEKNLNKRVSMMFEEFKKKCIDLEEVFDNDCNISTPGTWMGYDYFLNSFNNFTLFKNITHFRYKLNIDNIWYNYKNDLFEEKQSSNIVYLTKEICRVINGKNDFSPFSENELYILFEPNGERNFKSVSSELEYQRSNFTKNSNKFNDIEFSIILKIFIKKQNNKIKKIKEYIMKGYHMILNINLSDLNDGNECLENNNEFFIIIQGNKCPFGYFLQFFSNFFSIGNFSYNEFMINFNNFTEKKFDLFHPNLKQYKYYLMAHFIIEYNKEENKNNNTNDNNKIVKIYNDINNYEDNYIKSNIEIILINNINNKKVNIYCKNLMEIDFNLCDKYIIEISIRPPQDIPEKKFEYCLLYNSNIHFILCPNIQPFFIREKYIFNKYLILFNELIYPSEDVTAAFDISLEYRPNNNNENNENNDNNLESNDQIIPEEQQLKFDIPLQLSLDYGEKNILKKNFINNTNIRNLSLKGKLINTKEKDKNKDKSKDKQKVFENNTNDNNKNETYIIKCSLDPSDCPDYLKNFSLYKNDIYWKISVFSTNPICFVKNTMKEDLEESIKEGWEINHPGRAERARISRKKYLLNLKSKSGELLTLEEQKLLDIDLSQNKEKELFESSSNMIITNILPKVNNKNKIIEKNKNKSKIKLQKIEVENNNNTIENKFNFLFKDKKDNIDIMKKIPKMKKCYSFVMKNFYSYSIQNRVIIKNTMGSNILISNQNSLDNINDNYKSLPNIYCKTPDERMKEIKSIEDEYNNYNNMKILERNKSNNNLLFYKEEKDRIMKKLINKRFKLKKMNKENNMKLINIIKNNNDTIEKIIEINKLNKNISSYLKERDKIQDNEINEGLVLKWYESYMKILLEENKEYKNNNKINSNIDMIKSNLATLIGIKIKEIKKKNKKDNKLKKFIEIAKNLDITNKSVKNSK